MINTQDRIQLSINNAVITEFKNLAISMEYMGSVIFVLFALDEGRIDLLDAMDDRNTQKRVLLLYDLLVNKGLLSKADLEEDVHYTLTEKGINLIDFLKSEINSNQETTKPTEPLFNMPVYTMEKREESVEDWIEDYIKIFPKEKVGGRYLRTSRLECLTKMMWFIKTYKYDKNTILKATKAYISNQESDSNAYPYTRNSGYFISKQTGQGREGKISYLATWCERITNNDEDTTFNTSIMNSA